MSDQRPVILVVNDDPDVLELILSHLRYGIEADLVAADSGEVAIEKCRRRLPDLVIADVSMPEIDGFQLCRILKSPLFPGGDKVPIILVSATYRDVIAEQVARNVRALAFLQVPYDKDDLLNLVRFALKRTDSEVGCPGLLKQIGTVAVVDDDEDILRLLERVLVRDGWRVITAASGEEAKNRLAAESLQLVLLDFHLPDSNGLVLLDWVRMALPDTVVIMMTGDTHDEIVINLIKSGADDYLKKPFTPRTAVEVCRNALNKYNFLRIHEQFRDKMEHIKSVTDYLDMLVKFSQEAIFSCDQDGHVKIWNKGAEKIYGYAAEEIVGAVIDNFVDPPDFPRKSTDVVQILRQQSSFAEPEVFRRRKNGDIFPVSATYSAIRDAKGEFIGFSVIERDIAAVKALESEKIKSARLRAITQTAVTANDHINTPLGVILGYAQFLQKKLSEIDERDLEGLDIIQQQVHKIKGIMNKLKLMSDPIVKNYSIEGVTMLDLTQSK